MPSAPHWSLAGVGSPIASCGQSARASTIASGGTATFALSCSDRAISSATTVPSTLAITVSSGGFTVVPNAGGPSQLFLVPGGHLNVTGIYLEDGRASGTVATPGDGVISKSIHNSVPWRDPDSTDPDPDG
jgi:hypothetical protein